MRGQRAFYSPRPRSVLTYLWIRYWNIRCWTFAVSSTVLVLGARKFPQDDRIPGQHSQDQFMVGSTSICCPHLQYNDSISYKLLAGVRICCWSFCNMFSHVVSQNMCHLYLYNCQKSFLPQFYFQRPLSFLWNSWPDKWPAITKGHVSLGHSGLHCLGRPSTQPTAWQSWRQHSNDPHHRKCWVQIFRPMGRKSGNLSVVWNKGWLPLLMADVFTRSSLDGGIHWNSGLLCTMLHICQDLQDSCWVCKEADDSSFPLGNALVLGLNSLLKLFEASIQSKRISMRSNEYAGRRVCTIHNATYVRTYVRYLVWILWLWLYDL